MRNRQRGLGLIEVLISIAVIAVGILGSLSMQLSAKRVNHEAVQRSQASALAMDLLERMRVNPDSMAGYVSTWKHGDAIAAAGTDCVAATCSSAAMAAYDLEQWLEAVSGENEQRDVTGGGAEAIGGLTSPSVCVSAASGFVTVALAWKSYDKQTNPSVSTCGAASGLYGGANEYRQVLTMSSYIGT